MNVEEARSERESAMIRGVMWFLALVTVGMPFAIVTLYYLLGWRAAVFAFPFLFVVLFGRLSQDTNANPTRARLLRRVVSLVGLLGIPVTAVAFDEASIMRLWAYATALPLSFAMASDRKKVISPTGAILVGIAFVAASDLIWLYGSMAGWIWFHAFSVPIFFISLATLSEMLSRDRRAEERRKTRTLALPPRAENDVSVPARICVVLGSDGSKLIYEKPSLSQAKAIYLSDWRSGRDNSTGQSGEERKLPALMIAFAANGVLKFEVDGPVTVTVQWTYMELPERGRFLGRPTLVGGRRVPVELGHAIIADAWVDDVEALRDKLKPFDAAHAPGLVTPEQT